MNDTYTYPMIAFNYNFRQRLKYRMGSGGLYI